MAVLLTVESMVVVQIPDRVLVDLSVQHVAQMVVDLFEIMGTESDAALTDADRSALTKVLKFFIE